MDLEIPKTSQNRETYSKIGITFTKIGIVRACADSNLSSSICLEIEALIYLSQNLYVIKFPHNKSF